MKKLILSMAFAISAILIFVKFSVLYNIERTPNMILLTLFLVCVAISSALFISYQVGLTNEH